MTTTTKITKINDVYDAVKVTDLSTPPISLRRYE